jgi:hypothetical protein
MAISFKTLVDPPEAHYINTAAHAVIQFADMRVLISAILDKRPSYAKLHTIYFVLIIKLAKKGKQEA